MFKQNLRDYAHDGAREADGRGRDRHGGASRSSPTRVTLASGDVLKAHTLVWGAGLQGNELVRSLGIELERGDRIGVGPELDAPGHPELYAVGDIAAITDAKTEQVLPQLGSVALQSGEHAGKTIAARIAGKPTKPFAYRTRARWRRSGAAPPSCSCWAAAR